MTAKSVTISIPSALRDRLRRLKVLTGTPMKTLIQEWIARAEYEPELIDEQIDNTVFTSNLKQEIQLEEERSIREMEQTEHHRQKELVLIQKRIDQETENDFDRAVRKVLLEEGS